ncbi:MAG: hypothetical protein ABIO93_03485 [Dyadobacter sp.]|uniref:hypothetical protein n=1 Tax=Dyadobacter sp. TaxID=1914288 RepID=UPI0032630ABA
MLRPKYFLLIVCFFILAMHGHAHAQSDSLVNESKALSGRLSPKELRKGSFTLALNASGSGVNTINHSGKNWSLAPQVGYLVANRLVVGFQLSIGKSSQRLKTGTPAVYMIPEYEFYSVLPEIYSRYYLLDFKLKPFVQLSSGYNFQWGNEQKGSLEASSDSQNFALSGAFGLSFRIGRHVALEALYNARFDNNSRILDSNENLKYRLGLSIFIR